jgi:hypothetical protein
MYTVNIYLRMYTIFIYVCTQCLSTYVQNIYLRMYTQSIVHKTVYEFRHVCMSVCRICVYTHNIVHDTGYVIVYVYVCVHACVYMCMYTYTYTYTYTHMCMCTYIHTHTHNVLNFIHAQLHSAPTCLYLYM